MVAVGAAGDLAPGDAGEAGLVEDPDAGLGARLAAVGKALAGVQADGSDGGEDADLGLPGLEPQPLGLRVEPVAAVDRGDLDAGVAQPVGDGIGGGRDELDRAGHLPLGLHLLGDPVDGGVDADQPGLLPEAQQRGPALGGVAAAAGDVHLAAELAPLGFVRRPLGRREGHRHARDRHRPPRGGAVQHRRGLLLVEPAAHQLEVSGAAGRIGGPGRAVATVLDLDAVALERGGERDAGLRGRGPLLHRLAEHLRVGRREVGQLEGRVAGGGGGGDDERRLVVGLGVAGDARPELPPLGRRTPQRVGLVGDDHVPGVVLDLLEPVPGDHHPLEPAVAERGDGAAPVADRDRGGPVGDDEHPLRAAQVTHRGRAEDGGDRLADTGLVGQQELPPARRGALGDRVGRLELEPARLEGVGRLGGGRSVVGVEVVLDEPPQRVRARSVRR